MGDISSITTLAGDLARALVERVRDPEDRDEAIASVLRILGDASESDAFTRLHDLAAEIDAQCERNRERADEAAREVEALLRTPRGPQALRILDNLEEERA